MKLKVDLNHKVLVLFSALLLFNTKATAQTVEDKEQNETFVRPNKVEKQPEFYGGMKGFYKFFGAHFNMPDAAYENKISGVLMLRFNVEIDGSLSDIVVMKDLGYGLGEEAVRVLKKSPKWIPASDKGKPVPLLFLLPITITNVD
jgi:hypothetical protein